MLLQQLLLSFSDLPPSKLRPQQDASPAVLQRTNRCSAHFVSVCSVLRVETLLSVTFTFLHASLHDAPPQAQRLSDSLAATAPRTADAQIAQIRPPRWIRMCSARPYAASRHGGCLTGHATIETFSFPAIVGCDGRSGCRLSSLPSAALLRRREDGGGGPTATPGCVVM